MIVVAAARFIAKRGSYTKLVINADGLAALGVSVTWFGGGCNVRVGVRWLNLPHHSQRPKIQRVDIDAILPHLVIQVRAA